MGRHLDGLSHSAPARRCLGPDFYRLGRPIAGRLPFFDLYVVEPDRSRRHNPGDIVLPQVGRRNAADLIAGPVCGGGHRGLSLVAVGGLVAAVVGPFEEPQRDPRAWPSGLDPRTERVTHAGTYWKRPALDTRQLAAARGGRCGKRAVQRKRDARQVHRAEPRATAAGVRRRAVDNETVRRRPAVAPRLEAAVIDAVSLLGRHCRLRDLFVDARQQCDVIHQQGAGAGKHQVEAAPPVGVAGQAGEDIGPPLALDAREAFQVAGIGLAVFAQADIDGRLHISFHPQSHGIGSALLDRHVAAVELDAAGDELHARDALGRVAAVDVASLLGEHDLVGAVAVLTQPAANPPTNGPSMLPPRSSSSSARTACCSRTAATAAVRIARKSMVGSSVWDLTVRGWLSLCAPLLHKQTAERC